MIDCSCGSVNYLAVTIAAIVGVFGLGGLWYSPALFGNIWNRESGLDPKAKKGGHAAVVFGVSFVMGVISAFGLAVVINKTNGLGEAVCAGLCVGAFFVATSFAINYMAYRQDKGAFPVLAKY